MTRVEVTDKNLRIWATKRFSIGTSYMFILEVDNILFLQFTEKKIHSVFWVYLLLELLLKTPI